MSYKKYESYKESGIAWLGAMPSHWVATPIKHLGRLKGGAGFPHDDQGTEGEDLQFHKVNALGKANSEGQLVDGENTISIETAKRLGAHIFPEKSLVFAKVGAALFLARICQLAAPACIDNNMMGLMVDQQKFDPTFVKFAMSLVNFDLIANPGAVPSLNEGQIGNFKLGVPSLIEQNLIAEFLNNETSKIDELSKAFEGLIATLKEKRQAVISHAVTKGLDSSVPMRDSGIEWIGKVPEHWAVKSIGYVLDAVGDVDHFMPESVEKGVPYLMTGDLKELASLVKLEDCKQVAYSDYQKLTKKIKSSKGDVIVARYATIGTSMYVDIDVEFLVSYSCVTIKTTPSKVTGLYLIQYLKSDAFYQGINNQINTNTQANVGINDLKKLKIALPSLSEQSKIVEYLSSKLQSIDSLTEKAQIAVNLLQERRTALISAAVTGKIDVRGLVNINKEEEIKEAA